MGPESKQRTKALLFAAAKLASFAKSLGAGLEVGTVLSRPFIERFLVSAPMSPPTRRTLKTNLAYLVSHVPGHGPALTRCPRERAKAQYRFLKLRGSPRLAPSASSAEASCGGPTASRRSSTSSASPPGDWRADGGDRGARRGSRLQPSHARRQDPEGGKPGWDAVVRRAARRLRVKLSRSGSSPASVATVCISHRIA